MVRNKLLSILRVLKYGIIYFMVDNNVLQWIRLIIFNAKVFANSHYVIAACIAMHSWKLKMAIIPVTIFQSIIIVLKHESELVITAD